MNATCHISVFPKINSGVLCFEFSVCMEPSTAYSHKQVQWTLVYPPGDKTVE